MYTEHVARACDVGDHEVQADADSPYQQNYDLQFPNTLEPRTTILLINPTALNSSLHLCYRSFNFENVFSFFYSER